MKTYAIVASVLAVTMPLSIGVVLKSRNDAAHVVAMGEQAFQQKRIADIAQSEADLKSKFFKAKMECEIIREPEWVADDGCLKRLGIETDRKFLYLDEMSPCRVPGKTKFSMSCSEASR